jgi:hypothetical protein
MGGNSKRTKRFPIGTEFVLKPLRKSAERNPPLDHKRRGLTSSFIEIGGFDMSPYNKNFQMIHSESW